MLEVKVSVIVPVYNTAPYLKRCLDSILNQTLKEIEVICIDDGSTDNSLLIIKEYAKRDKRVIYRSIENGGVANARNVALGLVSGEYVAFCDSDDFVPRGAYQCMLKKTIKYPVDLVVGSYRDVNIEDSTKKELLQKRESNDLFNTVFFCPCLWNKMFRRQLICEQKIFFQSVLVGEDIGFLAQLYPHLKIVKYTKLVVYNHLEYSELNYISLNHTYTYEYFKAHIDCRENLLSSLKECDQKQSEKYVFFKLNPFLINFFFHTFDSNERTRIFDLLQNFEKKYDWSKDIGFFVSCFSTTPENFFSITVKQYVEIPSHERKNMVELDFNEGIIGFRYIFKYVIAWLRYKIRKYVFRCI